MQTDTDYVRAAYVRGGRPGVIEAVVWQLHSLGQLVSARKGTVRREFENSRRTHGFERVLLNAVIGSVAPGALAGRPAVDRALKELRADCVRAGLLRAFVPASWPLARRPHGRALMTRLRREYPLDSGEDLTMLVALYGRDALLRYAPRFARESGLLNRSDSDGFIDEAGPQGTSGLP